MIIMQFVMQLLKTFKAKIASMFRPRKPAVPKKEVFVVESKPVVFEPDNVRPTKAYADQRQKAARNRRREPSRRMRNLYHL